MLWLLCNDAVAADVQIGVEAVGRLLERPLHGILICYSTSFGAWTSAEHINVHYRACGAACAVWTYIAFVEGGVEGYCTVI